MKVFDDRWKSFFGVSVEVCVIVCNLLQVPVNSLPDDDLSHAKKPVPLLWALLFLKKYGDEREMAQLAGGSKGAVDEKTFRKWSHIFVSRIAGLVYDVVSCDVLRILACRSDALMLLTDRHSCFDRLSGRIERRVTRGMIVLCQWMAQIARLHTNRLRRKPSIPTSTTALVLNMNLEFAFSLVILSG
jgi:hypothetical protein